MRLHAQLKENEWKREDRIMMNNLFAWLFWSGAAVIVYSAVSASMRYVHFWRRGARTLAAQAGLQTILCLFGLVALWVIHRGFMPE